MTQELLAHYAKSAQNNIEEAECLPFGVYHNQEVYELEVKQVFHKDWVFACAASALEEVGNYFAFEIAGEQVVVLRGKDGELRCLSNNCRHRGTPLLSEGFGKLGTNIVCPYHAWTFDDTGKFRGAPFVGEVKLDKSTHCLPKFSVVEWLGLVFVCLDPSPPSFADKVSGIEQYLEIFELSRFPKSYHLPTEYWDANWKLAIENGIESYHLFKVHKETLEVATPTKKAFYVTGSAQWAITGGEIKDERSTLSKWLTGSYPKAYQHYLLLYLPPSLIAVIDYEGMHWINVMPTSAESCVVNAGGISKYNITNFDTPEFTFMKAFLQEDQDICERVQRGMHSQKTSGGKLVSMEKILVDFRQYLAKQLFNAKVDERTNSEAESMFLKT